MTDIDAARAALRKAESLVDRAAPFGTSERLEVAAEYRHIADLWLGIHRWANPPDEDGPHGAESHVTLNPWPDYDSDQPSVAAHVGFTLPESNAPHLKRRQHAPKGPID